MRQAQGDYGDDVLSEPQYRPMAEINMTPFVDVILVLLVIFMIAAPLMVQGVAVTLPRTSAGAVSQVNQPMIVTLARDRALYIRDERIDPAGLVDRLKALRSAEGDTIVYVRADKSAAYGDVMELLGRVGAGGYARVSLLAQPTAATEAVKAR
ncbi:MAG: biopolymer transporter ExbD [Beijerinckiaceae bacterium]|nr:biopolymer transporter ExbD [Beijerinckiaceae bacterium]